MAQQENAPNKPVHLMFLTGAIVAFYLTQWTIEWIWGYFATAPSELIVTSIAGLATLLGAVTLYRNDRVYQLLPATGEILFGWQTEQSFFVGTFNDNVVRLAKKNGKTFRPDTLRPVNDE